jgi:type 1 glutamine amidotransferase
MDAGNKIRRRDLLRNLGAFAASGVLVNSGKPEEVRAEAQNVAAGPDRPRVLAYIGDRYHNPDYIHVALSRLFRELDLPVDFTINFEEIDAARLQKYRLFVNLGSPLSWPNGYLGPDIYSYTSSLENPEDWTGAKMEGAITEAQGQAIIDFVQAGNGLYAYHQCGYTSLYSKNYREVMGGVTLAHPPLRPFKVKVVNHEHPITQGVQDFMVNDEQHFLTFDKDPKYLILQSENIDGLTHGKHGTTAPGGWAYDYGKGRVVYTAVGHTIHALWNPEYLKVQKNAVRWLLRMA